MRTDPHLPQHTLAAIADAAVDACTGLRLELPHLAVAHVHRGTPATHGTATRERAGAASVAVLLLPPDVGMDDLQAGIDAFASAALTACAERQHAEAAADRAVGDIAVYLEQQADEPGAG